MDTMPPIRTVFIVMMENRSFDHLLGHLALEGHDVNGLRADPAWLDQVASRFGGARFRPYPLDDPYDAIEADPPHGRASIATQLGALDGDTYAMDGFVESYSHAKGAAPIASDSEPPVMGWFAGAHAPVTDFLARNFAVCDRWHAALPAGTQPNRLMAMSGFSRIDGNQVPIPEQDLVYDWLDRHDVNWRVYHEGIPFFSLMLNRVDDILVGGRFRPFDQFFRDVQNEPPDAFPQVVFIEPVYSDAPHIGPSTDDHSPAGIRGGQEFLLEVYRALTQSPDIWAGSLLVLTYDEHGGFFDHVSPPPIRTAPPPDAAYAEDFASLGVRVPAIVVSPFVHPGSVHHGLFDHTSILKLLGELFGKDGSYSPLVDARLVGSVGDILSSEAAATKPPALPSLIDYLDRAPAHGGRVPGTMPGTEMEAAFQRALDTIRDHPRSGTSPYLDLLGAFPPQPGPDR